MPDTNEELDQLLKPPRRVIPSNLPPGKYVGIREGDAITVVAGPEGLKAAIEADELADAHDASLSGTAKMTVRDYAKLKHMEPQLVYYYIRTKKIKQEPCVCGRMVIDVASADEFFAKKEAKERSSR